MSEAAQILDPDPAPRPRTRAIARRQHSRAYKERGTRRGDVGSCSIAPDNTRNIPGAALTHVATTRNSWRRSFPGCQFLLLTLLNPCHLTPNCSICARIHACCGPLSARYPTGPASSRASHASCQDKKTNLVLPPSPRLICAQSMASFPVRPSPHSSRNCRYASLSQSTSSGTVAPFLKFALLESILDEAKILLHSPESVSQSTLSLRLKSLRTVTQHRLGLSHRATHRLRCRPCARILPWPTSAWILSSREALSQTRRLRRPSLRLHRNRGGADCAGPRARGDRTRWRGSAHAAPAHACRLLPRRQGISHPAPIASGFIHRFSIAPRRLIREHADDFYITGIQLLVDFSYFSDPLSHPSPFVRTDRPDHRVHPFARPRHAGCGRPGQQHASRTLYDPHAFTQARLQRRHPRRLHHAGRGPHAAAERGPGTRARQ